MAFSESVSLQRYVDAANEEFSESENRLSEIEGSFQTRMNGKTTGSLSGSIVGTACWLVAFCVLAWYGSGYVDSTLCLVCLAIGVALTVSLFIDEIIGFSYYGKIASYKNNITQLKNRVSVGRSSIQSNQDVFMESRNNGWFYPLSVGSSIPEEAASVESIINGMESLKGGFISGLKNFLFYTFVIAVTGVGSWALFGIVTDMVDSMVGAYIDYETLNTLCVIGLVIVEVGVVILAKMLWGRTGCTVTNTTLWIAPLGPVIFVAFAAAVTVVVIAVVWLVSLVIALIGIAVGIAIAAAVISGSSGG